MRKYPIFLITFSLLFVAAASAQLTDLRLPISLDADSTDYDDALEAAVKRMFTSATGRFWMG